MLVTIENAETMKTYDLLCHVLIHLNADNRVRFFVSRGKGASTVQCLRVMLSRTRKKLEAKGKRRKHFKLHADVFPHTNLDGRTLAEGSRMDQVILRRSLPPHVDVLETLEDLISNGRTITQLA